MNKTDITRFAVEVAINRALKGIKHDPKRTTRNLIDLGLSFSKSGRFHNVFFNAAHNLLKNQNSQYYKLAENVACYIYPKYVKTLGVNLGYNACTLGARKIREIEANDEFSVPWIILINCKDSPDFYSNLSNIISSGLELGIFTYCIFTRSGMTPELADIISKYNNCALAVFLEPECINSSCIDILKSMTHVYPVVNSRDIPAFSIATDALRNERMLYGAYINYNDEDENYITSNKWISEVSEHMPVMSILFASDECRADVRRRVEEYSKITRDEQAYPTFIIEYYSDALLVDGIISDQPNYLQIDKDGMISSNSTDERKINVASATLQEALKLLAPKIKIAE